MARRLRIQAPGIIYHVVSRGNGRQTVFLDDVDRWRFLALLGRTCSRHGLPCLAYCLMENHYHALLRTTDSNLSAAVHFLNACYAQWWNRRHRSVGHVWQGRFYSQLVQDTHYFHAAVAYVLRNPIRAGICRSPAEWRWSSFRASIGVAQPPEYLACDLLWQLLGTVSPMAGQERVKALVELDQDPLEPEERARARTVFAGDCEFANRARSFASATDLQDVATRDRVAGRPSIDSLFQAVTSRCERDDQIRRARTEWCYSLRDIGNHLGLHYSTVSKICSAESGLDLESAVHRTTTADGIHDSRSDPNLTAGGTG